jgi:hypothetical protein
LNKQTSTKENKFACRVMYIPAVCIFSARKRGVKPSRIRGYLDLQTALLSNFQSQIYPHTMRELVGGNCLRDGWGLVVNVVFDRSFYEQGAGIGNPGR